MILHMCSAEEWAAVPEGGSYRAASLDTEGFIHCSDPGTLIDVLVDEGDAVADGQAIAVIES